MSRLEASLATKHGPGIYLTPSQLNWLGGKSFTPEKPAIIKSDTTLCIDKPRPEPDNHRGDLSISLGEFNLGQQALPEKYDGGFTEDIIIKRPGEDEHFLPAQLARLKPIVQEFAALQYQSSPYATGKIGVLRISSHPLKDSIKQQGHGWHRHTLSIAKTYTPEHMENYEITAEDAEIISRISTKLAATEGFWSNACPTILQEDFADRAIPTLRSGKDSVHSHECPLETPPFRARRARANELNVGTSETFHTSAVPTREEAGLRRDFVYIAYFHTDETEAQYFKDYPDQNGQDVHPG